MLLKNIKKHLLGVIACFYSLIVALFWLALRVNWSGISKVLGADKNQSFIIMELPLLVCILLWVLFALSVASMIWLRDKKWPKIVSLVLSGVFTIVIIVIVVMGAIDYMYFIMPKFLTSLLVSLLIIAFGLLLFVPPVKNCKLCVALKCTCLALVILVSIFAGFGISVGSYFTYDAVVYAVEDEYQIVFSTNHSAIAWVEVDGEKYFDLYAGSMKSQDTVHKVSVPQQKLDDAKGYSIHAQKMIYRGPFGGYKGNEISKSYNFRPVDSSDGLVYYSMSDVHHARTGAVNTALSVKDLDFLVMLGDNTGMVDSDYDAQYTNILAYDVTKGEIPVVYARGNHEIKGDYAEHLHKYVGSKNGNFYYWFTLADVYGITLDLGEDHDDGWWEYYGTAQFSVYHAEQTQMLKDLIAKKDYENYNYTLVACHIPIQFVNYRKDHKDIKPEWTALLNEIQPDLAVYGHQHDLYPFIEGQQTMYDGKATSYSEKGKLVFNSQFAGFVGDTYSGFLTDFEFSGFIVGRRGTTQQDDVGDINRTEHIGMETRVDLAGNKQVCRYLNSSGNVVEVFNPFVEGPAQTTFELPLK